ncbi:AAA family ATPase [Sediminibacillus sp. JSM 1682029]|uniref:AAA family ATPase n=1 Tax=Sediminibacillus sp. JSM 1682029 TaxID=3229857 RepID=UPI003525144D
MTQYSYSRVSLFNDCPYHFKLRYIDKLTELPKYDAANPLIIGHALHKGIETDVLTAVQDYYNSFPVINDRQVEEAMKLEILIPKVKAYLEEMFIGFEFIHEYEIDKPDYKGFVDLIAIAPTNECVAIDFKYSNNIKNYLDSGQLHIYKHYLEQDGFDVKRMGYVFVPKTSIKQKQTEDLFHFRKRIVETVEASKVTFVPIDYDSMEVIYFQNTVKKIEAAEDYPKNVSGNCFSCNPRFRPNYLEAIENEKGEVEMVLPKNERRERTIDTKPDFWIYADSYVGKSTFVDNVENVLFLNTDGNTDNTTAPVIPIKDEVTKTGRITKRKLAWQILLDTISELETEENEFEAVALDLVEDIYEHCRVYVYDKNGWEHESDGSYGKGWDKVRTEFNNTMKRIKSLDYQLIYISKEIVEEYTLKGGAKRTTFKPNIKDKVANFLTGTVDLTLRAYINSSDERFLQLAKKQNVFGGGRFNFQVDEIPLEYDRFIEELTAAQEGKTTKKKTDKPKRERKRKDQNPDAEANTEEEAPVEEKPRRERKSLKNRDVESEETETEEKEEKPKRQRRQRKPVEDDTPPGESDDSESEDSADETQEEEKPTRRRRRRTRVNN